MKRSPLFNPRKRPRRSATPTQEQMLALVEKRVPHLTTAQKSALATAALAVLGEPLHKGKPLMHAVKMAVARSYRHS